MHIDEKVLFLDLVERQKMLKQAELAEVIFKAGKQAYEDNPQIRESINKSMGKAPESLDFSPFLDAIDTSESLTKDGLVPFDTMNNRELARKLIESQRFIEREKNTLDRLLDQQSVEMRDMLISIGENVNITSR